MGSPLQLYSLPSEAVDRSPYPGVDGFTMFLLPTIILTSIFITTEPSSFEYKIADPTVWGIYSSNFAHRSWGHLGRNLAGLWIIGGTEYLLLTATGYRKHYIAVFCASILVFPLFSHFFLQFVGAHQPIFQTYEAVGFSEPLAALTGYLPLALCTYLNKVGNLRWPILPSMLLASGGAGVAVGQLFGYDFGTTLLIGLGVLGLLYLGLHFVRTYPVADSENSIQYGLTILFVVIVFSVGVNGLFMTEKVGSIVGHIAGYLPGFLFTIGIIWAGSALRPGHPLSLTLD